MQVPLIFVNFSCKNFAFMYHVTLTMTLNGIEYGAWITWCDTNSGWKHVEASCYFHSFVLLYSGKKWCIFSYKSHGELASISYSGLYRYLSRCLYPPTHFCFLILKGETFPLEKIKGCAIAIVGCLAYAICHARNLWGVAWRINVVAPSQAIRKSA